MKKLLLALIMVVVGLALGCGGTPNETDAPAEVVVEQSPVEETVVEVRHDLVYACSCGPECDCGAVSLEPGTCDCGSELVQAHLLKIDGNVASLCTCGGDCTCELDAEDPTKCSCGSPVKQVSLEGKGLYYCNCGGSCTCNFVATEAGKCSCGMDLVTS